MPPDVIDHLARNHGLITTRTALALGLSGDALFRLARARVLVRVHRGVYRHAATPVTAEQRLVAGRDIVQVRGLATTSRARTLVDCCPLLPPVLLARQAHSWIAERRVSIDDMGRLAAAARNQRGVRQFIDVIDRTTAIADSPAEARLGRILDQAGLPPDHHVVVTTERGRTFELDWAYPAHRLGLEMDGYGVHLRSVESFDDDRFRRNELEIAGWRILNFTSRQLRRPEAIVDQVSRALALSTKPREPQVRRQRPGDG